MTDPLPERLSEEESWDGDDDLPPLECDHMEMQEDILTGRAYCYRCGHVWYPATRHPDIAPTPKGGER